MFWLLLRNRPTHFYSSFILPSFNITIPITSFLIPSSQPLNSTLPFKTPTLFPNPISPYSTLPTHRKKNKKPNKKTHPPFSKSELDLAISDLPSRFTPSDLTAVLTRQSNPLLCLHIFTHATHHPRFNPHPSSFLLTIKKLGTARLFPEMDSVASLALSLIPSLPISEPLLNTIIYFYAEARMLSKAIHAYKVMRSSPDPTARPTLRTYNLLFSALLGRGANSYIHHLYMDTLRSLFRQMLDSGVHPDIVTLNFMIRGYVQSLHLNDALRIFHQMGPVFGCEPDEHTYSYLVHGLCAQGRTRNAMEMCGEMRGKGMVPSGRACNSLVSALAMGGEVGEAVNVIWEMAGMGKAVDCIACRTVVEEICRQGKVEEAVGLLRELREKEIVDGTTYRELLSWVQDDYCGGD